MIQASEEGSAPGGRLYQGTDFAPRLTRAGKQTTRSITGCSQAYFTEMVGSKTSWKVPMVRCGRLTTPPGASGRPATRERAGAGAQFVLVNRR